MKAANEIIVLKYRALDTKLHYIPHLFYKQHVPINCSILKYLHDSINGIF